MPRDGLAEALRPYNDDRSAGGMVMPSTAKVERLPLDTKARKERQLAAKWARRDELMRQVRDLDREIAPLQREVSLGRGYLFTVGREALERGMRRDD